MNLRNILIGLGIFYFLTKKKKEETPEEKTDVVVEDKGVSEEDRKNRNLEIIDIEKKKIKEFSV